MNFYKRYMADYQSKTSRLTLIEHGAYTLLLDEYYVNDRLQPQLNCVRGPKARAA